MNNNDAAYYARRLGEENRRAASSRDAAVAQVHLQLASHYKQALASTSKGH